MRRLPPYLAKHLQQAVFRTDEYLDTARRRFDARFSRNRPLHIAAYRGFADASGVELLGRVLAQPPLATPATEDDRWDNLLDTYRRFESDEVPGVPLRATFRDASGETVSDLEGYYEIRMATAAEPS